MTPAPFRHILVLIALIALVAAYSTSKLAAVPTTSPSIENGFQGSPTATSPPPTRTVPTAVRDERAAKRPLASYVLSTSDSATVTYQPAHTHYWGCIQFDARVTRPPKGLCRGLRTFDVHSRRDVKDIEEAANHVRRLGHVQPLQEWLPGGGQATVWIPSRLKPKEVISIFQPLNQLAISTFTPSRYAWPPRNKPFFAPRLPGAHWFVVSGGARRVLNAIHRVEKRHD